MERGRLLWAVLLFALGALVGVTGSAVIEWATTPSDTPSTDALPLTLAQDPAPYQLGWLTQLLQMHSVEEASEVTGTGVYLARIVEVQSSAPGSVRLAFDWLGRNSMVDALGVERMVVTNESSVTQSLDALPSALVFLEEGMGPGYPDVYAPQAVEGSSGFYESLRGRDVTATRLLNSEWWVTVYGGSFTQLVQAPTGAR